MKIKKIIKQVYRRLFPIKNSAAYWEKRYIFGGNSGDGSYCEVAEFKAKVINNFVKKHSIQFVIDLGCGDGNQLSLAEYPQYLGLDVSKRAVKMCREKFALDSTKSFKLLDEYNGERADLTLSLEVIFHLLENEIFEDYMRLLFNASGKYVIIYSFDSNDNHLTYGTNMRLRKFTNWINQNRKEWKLISHIPNKYPYNIETGQGFLSDFYIYEKK